MFLIDRNHPEAPVFKVFAELAIPNVTIQPPTDEVQVFLNKAVQTMVSVAKTVAQWDKNRKRVSIGLISYSNMNSIIMKQRIRKY